LLGLALLTAVPVSAQTSLLVSISTSSEGWPC
jgi:hypothetical protein